MKQLITRIDDELHAQFKAAVAMSGENMTRLAEGWIRNFLETRENARDVELYDNHAHDPADIDLDEYLAERAAKVSA